VIRKAAEDDEEEKGEEKEDVDEEEDEEEGKGEKKTRSGKGGKAKDKERAKKKIASSQGGDALMGYSGVGIKVSFAKSKRDSGVDDDGASVGAHLMQLSGGQQAIVALALIFAIQRLDPSPFYLFDEIDAALDGVHRANVATMIHNQAHQDHPSQFITTTFSAEQIASVTLHLPRTLTVV
jgi:recombinational DNA repair ATPase RecF